MSILEQNLALLKKYQVVKEGHFILSSGLHSEYYIQCAKIMSNPAIAQEFCKKLASKISRAIDIEKITKIVAPAMGGLLVGYEIARILNKENIFCERVQGNFTFRRGFTLNKNDQILVIEDVLTTGKSSLETYAAIKKHQANIIAEACLIRRNPSITKLDNIPIIALLDVEFPTYDANNLPEHLLQIPVEKPGSRDLKKTN